MKTTDIRTAMELVEQLTAAQRLRRAVVNEGGGPPAAIMLHMLGIPAGIVVSGPGLLPLIDAAIADRTRKLAALGVEIPHERVEVFAIGSGGGRGWNNVGVMPHGAGASGRGWAEGGYAGGGGGVAAGEAAWSPPFLAPEETASIRSEIESPFSALAADVDRRGRVLAFALLGVVVAVVAAIAVARAYYGVGP